MKISLAESQFIQSLVSLTWQNIVLFVLPNPTSLLCSFTRIDRDLPASLTYRQSQPPHGILDKSRDRFLLLKRQSSNHQSSLHQPSKASVFVTSLQHFSLENGRHENVSLYKVRPESDRFKSSVVKTSDSRTSIIETLIQFSICIAVGGNSSHITRVWFLAFC